LGLGTESWEFKLPKVNFIRYSSLGIVNTTKNFTLLNSRCNPDTPGSAGETFVLKTIDRVVVMSDSTYGAFSDNPKRELPNGWIYSISTGDFRDASGVSFEGRGIQPDVYVKNTAEEIRQNLDRTLEEALNILRD
jgi:hypothetical protein